MGKMKVHLISCRIISKENFLIMNLTLNVIYLFVV